MDYSSPSIIITSTLRFCARPILVLFTAIGSLEPQPFTVMRSFETPLLTRYLTTDSPLFTESFRLYLLGPVESECPSRDILFSTNIFIIPASLSSVLRAAGVRSAFPNSKNMSAPVWMGSLIKVSPRQKPSQPWHSLTWLLRAPLSSRPSL